MAASELSSSNAFVSEVARYLQVAPDDVKMMIRDAKLPAMKIPKNTRAVLRVPLRDFHAWVMARTQNPTPQLACYPTFLADFHTAARVKKLTASPT